MRNLKSVHRIYHVWLSARTAGLGHDAVIEIMVALLGVMVAVLALVGFVLSVGLTAIGLFGYQRIKKVAVRSAKKVARKIANKVAMEVATDMGLRTLQGYVDQMQATGLSASQAEELTTEPSPSPTLKRPRTKATTDENLRKGKKL